MKTMIDLIRAYAKCYDATVKVTSDGTIHINGMRFLNRSVLDKVTPTELVTLTHNAIRVTGGMQ